METYGWAAFILPLMVEGPMSLQSLTLTESTVVSFRWAPVPPVLSLYYISSQVPGHLATPTIPSHAL